MAEGLPGPASLAGVVRELGSSCTRDEAAFGEVLDTVRTVDEVGVAHLIGMMARTHNSSQSAIQVSILVHSQVMLYGTTCSLTAAASSTVALAGAACFCFGSLALSGVYDSEHLERWRSCGRHHGKIPSAGSGRGGACVRPRGVHARGREGLPGHHDCVAEPQQAAIPAGGGLS